MKGSMPDRRQALVAGLFDALKDENGIVPTSVLKSRFDAKSTPMCMLGKKGVAQANQEFYEAADFFGGSGFEPDAFLDFFLMISAMHEDEDEFRLMMTAAFGLPLETGTR